MHVSHIYVCMRMSCNPNGHMREWHLKKSYSIMVVVALKDALVEGTMKSRVSREAVNKHT